VARLLVVDPLLVTAEFGLGDGWAGPEHDVVVPPGFALDDLEPLLAETDGILTCG
jgi:hypothetical protein